jgi:hypothetical protein
MRVSDPRSGTPAPTTGLSGHVLPNHHLKCRAFNFDQSDSHSGHDTLMGSPGIASVRPWSVPKAGRFLPPEPAVVKIEMYRMTPPKSRRRAHAPYQSRHDMTIGPSTTDPRRGVTLEQAGQLQIAQTLVEEDTLDRQGAPDVAVGAVPQPGRSASPRRM